jgi:hypothetical protein
MDRLANLTSQGPFDRVVPLQKTGEAAEFVLIQLSGLLGRANLRLYTSLPSNGWTNAVKILKRIHDLLVVWNVNT